MIVEVFPRHAVSQHTVERASFAMLTREAEAEWDGVGAFTCEVRTRSPTHAVAIEEDFAVGHRALQKLKRSPNFFLSFFPHSTARCIHVIECRPQETKCGDCCCDCVVTATPIYLMVFHSCRICAQYSGLAL